MRRFHNVTCSYAVNGFGEALRALPQATVVASSEATPLTATIPRDQSEKLPVVKAETEADAPNQIPSRDVPGDGPCHQTGIDDQKYNLDHHFRMGSGQSEISSGRRPAGSGSNQVGHPA